VVAKPKKRSLQNTREGLVGIYIPRTQQDLGIDVVNETKMMLKWFLKTHLKKPERRLARDERLFQLLTLVSE
jgi:hypothetical protein